MSGARPLVKAIGILALGAATLAVAADPAPSSSTPAPVAGAPGAKKPAGFQGLDDLSSNFAEQAGRPARKPYLDLEHWGDLWNLVLLGGGGISGFVIGRNWDQIWGRGKGRRPPDRPPSGS